MNFRRLKHTLLRLSLEEKVIGMGALIILFGCFFPWFSSKDIVSNKILSENAFTGDLGVIGFVIFLMALMGLLAMVSENMHLPFPKFGNKRENIVFFFVGQAAFLTLLAMAIYIKRSLGFTDAGLRFGIQIVLAASFFSALAGFSMVRKNRRREMPELEPELYEFQGEDRGANPLSEDMEAIPEEELEDAMSSQEDEVLAEEIEKEFAETEGRLAVEPHPITVKHEEKAPNNSELNPAQANYFSREAGIPEKTEEKK